MSVTIVPDHQPAQRGGITRGLTFKALDDDTARGERRRAVAALPFVAAPETAIRTLSDVARDTDLDDDLRRLATDAIARVDTGDTSTLLADLLRDDVPAVAAAAATALGRGAGGPGELDALAAVAKGRRGLVADRARFAAAIISHRADVAGHDPRRPEGLEELQPAGRAIRATVERARAAEARVARATVAEAMPLIEFEGPALDIRCAGRRQMLLAASEAAGIFAEPAQFAERRWYVGQLAFRNPTNGRYSPGLSILTTPTRGGVRIGLYRADGTLIYTGTGTVENGAFVATLDATARPGAVAVSATARVSSSGIDLDVRSGRKRAVEPRRPTPAG
jgi:hypothetical protein